jgi:heme/copper-type cytochrome/quinol oxidase subunit 1
VKISAIVIAHLATSIVLFIFGCCTQGNVDITFHDTYYVISNSLVIVALSMLFVLFGLIIWFIQNQLTRHLLPALNWIHFAFTFIGVVFISVFVYIQTKQERTLEDYDILEDFESYQDSIFMNELIAIILITLVLTQLVFVFNVIRAFLISRQSGT